MSYKTDNGGIAMRANVKLFSLASTWATRLSQIGKQDGKITICTYSLPRAQYIERILRKRPNNIEICANSKFADRALEISERFPEIEIHVADDVHAKIVLIEPETVLLSSENFGSSGWFETAIGIKGKEAYDFYYEQIMYCFKRRARRIFAPGKF